MEKFCTKCGAELDENGLCPECSEQTAEPETNEPKLNSDAPESRNESEKEAPDEKPSEAPEEPAREAENDTADEAEDNPTDESEGVTQDTVKLDTKLLEELASAQPDAEPAGNTQAAAQDVQPSKFYYAFRQIGIILKGFFSKHTVDTISNQYYEPLPVWTLLFPICALISALSMTLSFDGTHGLSIGAGSLFSGMALSGLEVFLISFAMSAAVEFVYSLAVRVFFKSFKIKTTFKSVANLTMCAYLPVTIIDLFNIMTIGYFKTESTTLSAFGTIAFILLLYLGITKILDGKKPFWSFFLTMTCASIIALLAALVVTCPIIVMRGLEELANTTILLN